MKRFFTGEKVRQAHKLYPEEYFKQYWFNRPDSLGIKVIAKIKGSVQERSSAHHFWVSWSKKNLTKWTNRKNKPKLQNIPGFTWNCLVSVENRVGISRNFFN
jgi:hypothetical protein